MTPPISQPRHAQHPSTHLLQSAGVAIFHLRTSRVVVCYHSREKYWFLPKGRRDVGEGIEAAGEREGYEETFPSHIDAGADHDEASDAYTNVTEPVWVQLMPYNRVVQYLLYWFISETVPPDVEEELAGAMGLGLLESKADRDQDSEMSNKDKGSAEGHGGDIGKRPQQYCRASPFPRGITLRERIEREPEGYVPRRHPGTGLEEDEKYYESYLLSVEEAMDKLSGTIEQDVVRIGWEGIENRLKAEAERAPVN